MAKIRITIMTENDKHFDDTYSNERIEDTAKKAWQWVFDAMRMGDPFTDEKATVEKCEVVER